MSHAMPQYLRTYRKRAGFTQHEVASLLGLHTAENVSRYERMARRPTLETAIACELIFGVPARVLLPGLYREVEQGVRRRARNILKEHESRHPQVHSRKRAALESLASTTGKSNTYAQ